MRADGIRVVSTKRESELDEIRALGRFDIVVAGAVIEHVPHTHDPFSKASSARSGPGGLLLLDTPNVLGTGTGKRSKEARPSFSRSRINSSPSRRGKEITAVHRGRAQMDARTHRLQRG
jgi:2-polyprenyl-3-methyl-5-hydroxy-6-metoxy-1,4-benzoquinol methylase